MSFNLFRIFRDRLTNEQLEELLAAPRVAIPPEIKVPLGALMQDHWSTRPNKKPFASLRKEASHTCTREWLQKYIYGDGVSPGLIAKRAQRHAAIQGLRPENVDDHTRQLDQAELVELSNLFLAGFFDVFRENLVHDDENGLVIGVKEKDIGRFSQCHTDLRSSNQGSGQGSSQRPVEGTLIGGGGKRRSQKRLKRSRRNRVVHRNNNHLQHKRRTVTRNPSRSR